MSDTPFRVLVCSVDATPCPAASQQWATLAEVVDPASLGIAAADILYVYTWGVGAVLSMWALGYAVGAAITALRKA